MIKKQSNVFYLFSCSTLYTLYNCKMSKRTLKMTTFHTKIGCFKMDLLPICNGDLEKILWFTLFAFEK